MRPEQRIVIVGGGPAALSTARSDREAGGGAQVDVVCAEPHLPYDRPPLTKELLRGELEPADLPLEDEAWFTAHAVTLRRGRRAARLDRQARCVQLQGGQEVPYDACVLATGSAPQRPPVDGAQDPDLHTIRTVARRRAGRLEARLHALPGSAHPHFSGASIAVTASTYRRVGGLEPHAALEDEAFARALARAEVHIARIAGARVRTSPPPAGRAFRGLARDLALDAWLEANAYAPCRLGPAELAARKTATVSVVVPAREVVGTIGATVAVLRRFVEAGAVDELLVVDAASRDGTAAAARAAGATVVGEDDLMRGFGPCRGKGDAMWRALAATTGEIVAYVDADSEDFGERMLTGLLAPLFARRGLALVKGALRRPFATGGEVRAGEAAA